MDFWNYTPLRDGCKRATPTNLPCSDLKGFNRRLFVDAETIRWAAILLLLASGCAKHQIPTEESKPTSGPNATASLDDLGADVVSILRELPNVASVQRYGPSARPTHRIIHFADWHFVSREHFAADLRSLSSEPFSEDEVDRRYEEFLDEVSLVQEQQTAAFRSLIQRQGLKRIHIEGLTDQDRFIFDAKVSALRKAGRKLADLRAQVDELLADREQNAKNQPIIDQLREIVAQQRRDLLQLGTAGRLLLNVEIEAVVPLEDAEAYMAANPVQEDGTVVLDQQAIKARQDAQVKLLLNNGPCAVIVLGGAHNLSENIARLSGGTAEYIRVEVKAWQEVAREREQ